MRRAVIDIGTNTVKLLVADIRDGQIFPVVSKDQTTRLGEGVATTRQLSPAAIARTVGAITGYVADARELEVTDLTAFTTSAARDAGNQQEFLDAVRQQCGLAVEVLTGQREAELIFRGVASDPDWAQHRLLVLDIGGGSAEVIQGQAGRLEQWASLPLGAVRLTEQFRKNSFADLAAHVRTLLRAALTGYDVTGRQFIATGGATTTLGRILTVGREPSPTEPSLRDGAVVCAKRGSPQTSHGAPHPTHSALDTHSTPAEVSGPTTRPAVDHAGMTFEEVSGLVSHLNAMTLAERRQVPGLPPERADIIVAGGAVLMFAMEALGAMNLTVSTRNLRYGALL